MNGKSFLVVLLLGILLAVNPSSLPAETPYQEPGGHSLRTVPDTAPLQFLSALDYLEHGDTPAAMSRLRRTLRRFPRHRRTLAVYLELTESNQGIKAAFERARRHVERVSSPDVLVVFFREDYVQPVRYRPLFRWLHTEGYVHPLLTRLYGEILVEVGQYGRAVKVLETLIAEYPDTDEGRKLLALALGGRGDCDRALAVLNDLIQSRPGWPIPYGLKISLLKDRGQPVDPNLLEVYESLAGESYSKTDRRRRKFVCENKN